MSAADQSWPAWLLSQAPEAVMLLLAAGMLIALSRLALGPTRADRAVVLDLVALLVAGLLGSLAIAEDEPLFLDVAIVVVVTSFLVTVAIAQLIGRTDRDAVTEAEETDVPAATGED